MRATLKTTKVGTHRPAYRRYPRFVMKPKVVKMIRDLLAKVNIKSGKSENRFNLAQLDQQLVFRQGEAVRTFG